MTDRIRRAATLRSLPFLLPLALLPPLGLNSCLMVSAVGPKRESHDRLELHEARADKTVRKDEPRKEPRSASHRNPTRKQIVAAWGEPDQKRKEADGGETLRWRHDDGIWTGFLAIVGIVPVPLALPVIRASTEVRFGPGDGPALEWISQSSGEATYGIGLSPFGNGLSPDGNGRPSRRGPFFWYNDFATRKGDPGTGMMKQTGSESRASGT